MYKEPMVELDLDDKLAFRSKKSVSFPVKKFICEEDKENIPYLLRLSSVDNTPILRKSTQILRTLQSKMERKLSLISTRES